MGPRSGGLSWIESVVQVAHKGILTLYRYRSGNFGRVFKLMALLRLTLQKRRPHAMTDVKTDDTNIFSVLARL